MTIKQTKSKVKATEEDFSRIAQAIGRISDAGRALQNSGLTRAAVLTLLHDSTKLSKRDIGIVLDEIENLKRWCLRQ